MSVFSTSVPPAPLADFVECLWWYESSTPLPARERRLPAGSVELVINLREEVVSVSDRQETNTLQDFQEFCGLTPRRYLAQRGQFRHHVPLLD